MTTFDELYEKEANGFCEKVALNIKKIRKKKDISQDTLAKAIGHKAGSSLIGKIEAGRENQKYNLKQIYKIAKFMEVDVCEFFNEL